MMDVLFVQELGLKERIINCWGIKTVILVVLNLKKCREDRGDILGEF